MSIRNYIPGAFLVGNKISNKKYHREKSGWTATIEAKNARGGTR